MNSKQMSDLILRESHKPLNRRSVKVSLITVTLNSSEYLEGCIRSVISQHHPSIEHIIVDGGSTDRTLSIIKNYDAHISNWVSEKDNGM